MKNWKAAKSLLKIIKTASNFISNDIIKSGEWDSRPGITKPERTCAACGTKSVKDDFLRFVLSPDGQIICDVRKKIQSRGVYLCPEKDCISKGLKKKVFSRFFQKEGVEPLFEEFGERLVKSFEAYLFSIMELAFKSGGLISGSSAVFDAVDKNKACLLMVSDDAGRSVREKVEYLSKQRGLDLVVLPDKLHIAERMDRAVTAVMAVTDGGFARNFKRGWHICTEAKMWYNGENKCQR